MTRFFNPSILAACIAVLALAGCARDNSDYRASALPGTYGGGQGVVASAVPAQNAAAMLPPAAGRIIQVSERRYADGISQAIVYAGDRGSHGENRIEISMRLSPQGDQVFDNLLPLQRPSDADIASELETRFPGIRMENVNVLLQNRYGPYGLAAGARGASERCIYAWQWIDDIGAPPSPRYSALGNAILSQPQPASIRVRLCRTGVSADQLAGLMDAISIGGGMGGRQLPTLGVTGGFGGDALTAASSSGVSRSQSFQGYQLPQTSVFPAEAGRPVAQRQRSRLARHVRKPRRYARRQAPVQQPVQYQQAQPQTYVQPGYSAPPQAYAQPGYGSQPQAYALPSQAAIVPQQAYAPPPAFAAPAMAAPRTLDPSLPSQAYSGPSGAGARPVRVIPLGAPAPAGTVLATQPRPAARGRLQRDPVVQGPGV